MCKCTPEIRTPFCGKQGCEVPVQLKVGNYYHYKKTSDKFELIAIRGKAHFFWDESSFLLKVLANDDLLEVTAWEKPKPPKIVEGWLNVYPNSGLHGHSTKESANHMADKSRLDCLHIRYDGRKPLKQRITIIED